MSIYLTSDDLSEELSKAKSQQFLEPIISKQQKTTVIKEQMSLMSLQRSIIKAHCTNIWKRICKTPYNNVRKGTDPTKSTRPCLLPKKYNCSDEDSLYLT